MYPSMLAYNMYYFGFFFYGWIIKLGVKLKLSHQ